jgi:hypothetical protein
MSMQVNETRRDNAATCIDEVLCLQVLPHSDYVALRDKEVSGLLA